jgi:hypothetical protein
LAHLPHLEELVVDHLGYPLQLPLADVADLSSLHLFSAAKAASVAPLYIPEDSAVLLLSSSGAGARLATGASSSSISGAAGDSGPLGQPQQQQQQQGAGGGQQQGPTSSSSLEDWVWRWCAGRLTGLTSLRLEGYRISGVYMVGHVDIHFNLVFRSLLIALILMWQIVCLLRSCFISCMLTDHDKPCV